MCLQNVEMDKRRNSKTIFILQQEASTSTNEEYQEASTSTNEEYVDFVLVYTSKQASNEKRILFEKELSYTCVILGTDWDGYYHYTKIQVPKEAMYEYAEVLKLRMPLNLEASVLKRSKYSALLNKIRGKKYPRETYKMTAEFSKDHNHMFHMEHPDFFDAAARIFVTSHILECVKYGDGIYDKGIKNLIAEGAYKAAFPLHDGPLYENNARNKLYERWASFSRWTHYQPIDEIKNYFGVRVAMYFSWLGYYNGMLILASVVGVCCFAFSILTMGYQNVSQEICNQNVTMCPLCDRYCPCWELKQTCMYAKINNLVDNDFIVVHSVFMSVWGAILCIYYRRYTSVITHRWGVVNYNLMVEPPRPKYLKRLIGVDMYKPNEVTRLPEPVAPFWKMQCPTALLSFGVLLLWCLVGIGFASGIVSYKMSKAYAKKLHENSVMGLYIIPMTAVSINVAAITILNLFYRSVVERLTDFELHRTQTEYLDSLALKIYAFSFITYYSPVFYVAFMKGKFIGYPGSPATIFGYRREECSPRGCMMELTILLMITMVGKQICMTAMHYFRPLIDIKIKKKFQTRDLTPMNEYNRYAENYNLLDTSEDPLLQEYLGMVLQFGFITIFASVFPLAPVFALLSNILEVRIGATKLLKHFRRPEIRRVNSIGVWSNIMGFVYRLSIITNPLIIAFNSQFIKKMVYNIGSKSSSYLQFELSDFATEDFPEGSAPEEMPNVTRCSYMDFRHPPEHPRRYQHTMSYWQVFAAQLVFVIVYLAFILITISCIQLMVPTMPHKLNELIDVEGIQIRKAIWDGSSSRQKANKINMESLNEEDLNATFLNEDEEDVIDLYIAC